MNTNDICTDTVVTHPIQLMKVDVIQSFFANHGAPSLNARVNSTEIEISHLPGELDVDKKVFTHRVRAVYNLPKQGENTLTEPDRVPPFSLLVELAGTYQVINSEIVTEEIIQQFQQAGAAATLSPFLREHVYAITMRGGVWPVLLPLTQVPVVRVL